MHTKIRFRFVVSAALLFVTVVLAVTGIGAGQAVAAPAAAVLPPSTACSGMGSGTVTCNLWAKTGTLTLPGAVTVPVWGYADSAGGSVQVPGPVLEAFTGDTVTVNLTNNLGSGRSTSLYFEGQALVTDLTGVGDGLTKSYTFSATDPGTFLYEAGPLANAQHQVPMGLYGALIIRPGGLPGQAYANPETAFNDEALVVLSEIDPALNNNVSPEVVDLRYYKPRYFLINGKAYPQTAPIDTLAGNKVLLRYVNAGQQAHTMASLGVYQKVLGKSGAELPFYRQVLSEVLSTGQSMDAIVTIPASAPVGTRFALYEADMMLHNNGAAGFGGMLTFLTIPGGGPGPDTLGPAANALALSSNPTNGSVNLTLTASISDAGRGDGNIQAAEYRIDSTGAPAVAMAATDSAFDTPTEAVNGTLSVATLGSLPSGMHTIYVRGQDAAGNWGPFNSIVLNLDKTGPATTGIGLNPATSTGTVNVVLQATGNDTASGNSNVTAAEYFIDATGANGAGTALTPNQIAPTVSFNATIAAATMGSLAEGAHTVYVHSLDALGNWGTFSTVTLGVDKTGPTATGVSAIPSPNNGTLSATSTTQSVRVDATLNDPLSGGGSGIQSAVKGAEGFIDTVGAPGTGFAFTPNDGIFNSPSNEKAYAFIPLSTVRALSDGPHTVHVRGKDAAGNWGATTGASLVVDKTKPTISGISAAPNPTSGAATVTLTATAIDPDPAGAAIPTNIVRVEWFRGTDPGAGNATAMTASDGTFDSPNEPVTAAIDVTTWALGNYPLYVRAKDAAGNWGTVASTTLVVSDPPVYFSTVGNTNPPGVGGAADDADIYIWNGVAFSREFDASANGLPGNANIDGYVRVDATHFYVSFSADTLVPGLGPVQDEDVVYYNNGVWSVYFDGTAAGLTAPNQDIDAIDLVGGVLYFSTVGNTNPPGVGGAADDADIYTWNGASFSRSFDASTYGLPNSANVDSYVRVDATHFYMSFSVDTTVPILGAVQDEDIVYYNNGVWSTFFDGTSRGLTAANEDIDAFDLP